VGQSAHNSRARKSTVARIERLESERDRAERRAAWSATRTVNKREHCARGRGFLANHQTREFYPAPCRQWRECEACARAYGAALAARWSRVTGLRAFIVLTMPPGIRERWQDKDAIAEMMRAWHRLYKRICRRLKRGELSRRASGRPKLMHFKEHAGEHGGLHLNIVWDVEWIEQHELSRLAEASGFGKICHVSRIGREPIELMSGRAGCSPSVRYAGKQAKFRVVAYARKTGSQTGSGDDWPRHTRRWSAARAASREMRAREANPDWYWSSTEPRPIEEPAQPSRLIWLLPDRYLPHRSPLVVQRPRRNRRAYPFKHIASAHLSQPEMERGARFDAERGACGRASRLFGWRACLWSAERPMKPCEAGVRAIAERGAPTSLD